MISYFVIIFVMRKGGLGALSGLVLGTSVVLGSLPAKADNLKPQVAGAILDTKCGTEGSLSKLNSKKSNNLSELLSNEIETNYKGCISEEQLKLLKDITSNPEFLKELEKIRKQNEWSNEILNGLISLILIIISYSPFFLSTFKGKYANPWSAIGFGVSSSIALYLNGLVPGALSLIGSILCSSVIIGLIIKNKLEGKSYEDPELLDFFEHIPLPFSRYNKSGSPVVWNKELEKITGYTKEEVLAYYKEKGEILTLLYEGEELERVKKYLSGLKEGGYVDVPFTLKTKSGENVTLYWTSYSDGKGGRYSFANYGDELLKKMFDDFPHPVSKYDEMGKPLVWNKALEKVTGYSHEDVLVAWEEASEEDKKTAVMKLLYKGEDLARVEEHLKKIDDFEKHLEGLGLDKDAIQSKRGYENIAFTMTRKDGEKVTLLWTTMPDGKGGTLRTAVELTNIEDIKRELENTKRILRTDELTKALNLKALKQDLHTMFTRPRRKNDLSKKVFAIIDLDWFKGINDTLGHNVGDEVLIAFVNYINSKIRAGEDNLYRIGGDEFLLAFDSDDIDTIVTKINGFREGFFATEFPYDYQNSKLHVGSSWGIKIVTIDDYRSSDLTEEQVGKIFKDEIKEPADYYMYAVKYFRFILPELEARGLDLSQTDEKNGQAYELYDDEGKFIGVRVIKTGITFDLSVEELELIDKRKKEKADEIAQRK